ncbi:3-hydroxyacyl-CoA dehydrogenase/enoyl-CoA hydratase family protein [Gracilibacillus thailandensis]|uniref:3-hydroxyacyl-CoA dehydrogenase n=1 Tax=Gracilibacillus thailandensis TaxID=563735 RepID=A0A6N7R2U8_9BACI|nr:3-hydroxyacyl-CoA dehydrogenase/enoyl-CoA hydratase family protein [Gracilibacillus thailandensis]MRI67549.1 3-hydroxyacyl-CoA dehydrogenase [Gracilibacillus thailandensis]
MERQIRRAAVIGSGVMGASIAAHLANVGIPCLLLDMVPEQLTEDEKSKGLHLDSKEVRNRLAINAIKRLKKTKPAPLYDEDLASFITPGNIEDDLERIKEVDWVVEVIVENLAIKRQLLERIEKVWEQGIIVSSNTSGISINAMVEGRSAAFKEHFLGTHFFNPPRYMKLLEIIPGKQTRPEIIDVMNHFCEKKLGKGVVVAKDTPNFIANRIGAYSLHITLNEMLDKGYTVEEIDACTGPAIGRPKSATFRTLDLVGLDTFVHIANNMYEKLTDEEEKKVFKVPEILRKMVEKGWIGEKTGQGFYKKVKNENKKEILSLNVQTMEYEPQKKTVGASLEAAKMAKGTKQKLKALLSTQDQYSQLAWNTLKKVLLYSAEKVGEIADSILEIDQAMKWGFNWELGPFETWDAIGLETSVKRMEAEGESVPRWVKDWIKAGNQSFYKKQEGTTFFVSDGSYKQVEPKPEVISLRTLKEQNKVVKSNSGASLIDLDDGIACLEFHSPNNAIGADILMMIEESIKEVRRNYDGLVIANQGRNFCVGANLMMLLMEAQDEEWDEVDHIIRQFQNTMYHLKQFEKLVIAAPHRMTLGGGVEVCLPADQVVASAETYYGLVEVGVGLIPAGGGCKELIGRLSNSVTNPEADLQPYVNQIFETIGMAKVSTSALDAKKLGYLRDQDTIVVHQDHLIYEAKQAALRLIEQDYTPEPKEEIRVVGSEGKAVLKLGAYQMKLAGYISDHDQLIANKLAHVLAGGDVPAGTRVSEQYMLDLEREAFLSLCGEPKTRQRMQYMLSKGKPLRN